MTETTGRAPGLRERNRRAIEAEILDSGRRHLATEGAAALSLRAVARDLGMVSSAVYRYVESRDELLTRLIVASYSSLADAVDDALVGHEHPGSDAELRRAWTRLTTGMRRWALDRPHEWALLYGSPVPDYEAPQERTTDAGTRVLSRVLALRATHPMHTTATHRRSRGARAAAKAMIAGSPELTALRLTPDVLLDVADAWVLLVGVVNAEIFGYFGPLADPEALFTDTCARALAILTPS